MTWMQWRCPDFLPYCFGVWTDQFDMARKEDPPVATIQFIDYRCEGFGDVMAWEWVFPYLNETLGLNLMHTAYRDGWPESRGDWVMRVVA